MMHGNSTLYDKHSFTLDLSNDRKAYYRIYEGLRVTFPVDSKL